MTLFDRLRSTSQLAGRAMANLSIIILGEAPVGYPEERAAAERYRTGWTDHRDSETYREWLHSVARVRYDTVAGREWQADQLKAGALRLREWQDAQTSEAADEDTQPDITPYKAEFECPACGAGLTLTASPSPYLDYKQEGDRYVPAKPTGVWQWVGDDAVYVPPGPPSCWGRLSRDGGHAKASAVYVPSLPGSPGGWQWTGDDVAGLFDEARHKQDAAWDRMGTVHDKGHAPASAAESGQ